MSESSFATETNTSGENYSGAASSADDNVFDDTNTLIVGNKKSIDRTSVSSQKR